MSPIAVATLYSSLFGLSGRGTCWPCMRNHLSNSFRIISHIALSPSSDLYLKPVAEPPYRRGGADALARIVLAQDSPLLLYQSPLLSPPFICGLVVWVPPLLQRRRTQRAESHTRTHSWAYCGLGCSSKFLAAHG
jgi:hypothetical protein